MQNALKEYLDSKMSGSFVQSDNLLQHDAQYQALVASLLNGNLAGTIFKVAKLNVGMLSGNIDTTVLFVKQHVKPKNTN